MNLVEERHAVPGICPAGVAHTFPRRSSLLNQESMIDAVWMFVAVGRIGFHIGSTKRCNAAPGQTLRIPSQSSAFYDKWVQVCSAHSTSFPTQIMLRHDPATDWQEQLAFSRRSAEDKQCAATLSNN